VTDRQVHGHAPIVSVGDTALMDKSGTAYVPVSDQVGTVWNLTDPSAAKANSYAYDAFGVGRITVEAVGNRYRFGMKRLGCDAAAYHFSQRQLLAAPGRFLSRDGPVRRVLRMIRYSYAWNAPTSVVDPSGAFGIVEAIVVILLVALLAAIIAHVAKSLTKWAKPNVVKHTVELQFLAAVANNDDACPTQGVFSPVLIDLDVSSFLVEWIKGIAMYPGVTVIGDGRGRVMWIPHYCDRKFTVLIYAEAEVEGTLPSGKTIKKKKRELIQSYVIETDVLDQFHDKCCNGACMREGG
jgi:RHS repeat-associated protein